MPITQLRLRNFKCFEDSGDIPLAPLTLIFGRNNSGKSSILRSLLLLRQTLDSPEYGPRLNLRGPLYPAGTFEDMVHQHRKKAHVEMRFRLRIVQQLSLFEAALELPVEADLALEFRSDEPQPPRLARLEVQAPGTDRLDVRPYRGRGGPLALYIRRERLGHEKEANFRFPVNQFLPLIGDEPPKRGRPNARRAKSRTLARHTLLEFEKTLQSLRAVGAFRQQPDRRYEYQGRVPELVDLAGKNVAYALMEDATRKVGRGTLIRIVNHWLKQVGRVRLRPLRRTKRAGRLFEVQIRDTDSARWANFADVGFGIGQAIPVLVEGLRTPPGGTFIVEEPEIHLHPDAQLAIADFLIDLAQTGRRVIAETHSDALLLRVRRRIVEARVNGRRSTQIKPDDVSIVHVDKDAQGRSHARQLTIDELGQIKNWPADFMEEANEERIELIGGMAKRVESTR